MTDKELLDTHPLFNRLTGQVVWMLFEEHGVPLEDIEGFMLRFAEMKAQTASLLRSLRAGPQLWMQLFVPQDIQGVELCEDCLALAGKAIHASHPALIDFVPPFSLGCRLQTRLLDSSDFQRLNSPVLIDTVSDVPRARLVCQSEWIFSRRWRR